MTSTPPDISKTLSTNSNEVTKIDILPADKNAANKSDFDVTHTDNSIEDIVLDEETKQAAEEAM